MKLALNMFRALRPLLVGALAGFVIVAIAAAIGLGIASRSGKTGSGAKQDT